MPRAARESRFEKLEDRLAMDASHALVMNINPRVTQSIERNSSDIENFVEINDVVLFTANDGIHGTELWRTDGTADGTFMLRDILSGKLSSNPNGFTEFKGEIYFQAYEGGLRKSLYRTDGTQDGTKKVKGGIIKDNVSSIQDTTIVATDSLLYFGVYQQQSGWPTYDLWATDGTTGGARLIKAFEQPTGDPPRPTDRAGYGNFGTSMPIDDVLYFTARTPQHGIELWKSDGTEAGTEILLDAFSGPLNGWPLSPVAQNDKLYFISDDLLRGSVRSFLTISDGTPEGTRQLREFEVDWESGLFGDGELIYFTGKQAANSRVGFTAFRSDGTVEGTSRIMDYQFNLPSREAHGYQAALGKVFFIASDGSVDGNGDLMPFLWATDGTREGTERILDFSVISPIPTDEPPYFYDGPTVQDFVEHQGYVYFGASVEAPVSGGPVNQALYRTDGTADGTELIPSPTGEIDFFRGIYMKAVFDEKIYVTARGNNDTDGEIWYWNPETEDWGQHDIWPTPTPGFSDTSGIASTPTNPLEVFHYKDMLLFPAAPDGQTGDELVKIQIDRPNDTIPGDINGDGSVLFADFLILTANYGKESVDEVIAGDLDEDGRVAFSDFLILTANFGTVA